MVEKLVKICLSVLLLVCIFDMPYGFYEIVRFLALVGFGYLAIKTYRLKNQSLSFVYVMLAILFQPIFKIALGREFWNVVDIIVAIGLSISLLIKRKIFFQK
jgi:hypothetical protein